MPATSEKQKRLMDAAAHNPAFAKAVGIPASVAKDFSEASKGMKFGSGSKTRADLQKINNPKTEHGQSALFAKGGKLFGGKESYGEELKEAKMAKGGNMATKKMASGGNTTGKTGIAQKNGMTTQKMGAVRTAAPSRDGLAQKGKTRGMMPKMAGNVIGTGPAMKRGGRTK
jgi:hypothetical protein